MAAELQIYKYSGKDGTFGTPVTGIGIKRIDAVVPAVYQSTSSGGTVTPSDDKSDANTYCIYRPDDPDATAYSFESVFKLVSAILSFLNFDVDAHFLQQNVLYPLDKSLYLVLLLHVSL